VVDTIEARVIQSLKPKQNVKIYLKGESSSLSKERRLATITAFAGIMGISPEEIEVYAIYEGDIVFDLGVSAKGVERLYTHIQSNKAQLRLLGVKAALIERESGVIESWMVREGKFEMDSYLNPIAPDRVLKSFVPVPGIWRFHLIYLLVTMALGGAIFPFSQFISVLLISGVCAFGIILAFSKRLMAAHVLAAAIGLGTPIVVLANLLPAQTAIFFLLLIFGISMLRRFLF